jgi:excisionase family DNA binding protein
MATPGHKFFRPALPPPFPYILRGLFLRGSMDATALTPYRSTIEEVPIRVREAAIFLGVSPQTVYLWVERKQIPHLRVMGRNIRFLKSELEPFRAQFKQEIGNGKAQ